MGSFVRGVKCCLSLVVMELAAAQSGIITTIAGTAGTRGFGGDGAQATASVLALANLTNKCDPNQFEQTSHISIDTKGNLYIADSENQRVRRIATDGLIATVAGTGATPAINGRCEPTGTVGDDDQASNAKLFNPGEVLLHPNGNLIIADQQNNRIRQVSPSNVITTIAGNGLHALFAPGNVATSSPMDWPSSLAVDSAGLIYFAELHGNRIGRINADAHLARIVGTGFPGYNGDNIAATSATLTKPAGIAFDVSGNLLIADTGNHRVRKVSGGVITTIAGTGRQDYCGDGGRADQACLNTPMDVKGDALGNIYIADTGNHRVRRIDSSGTIATIAGTGLPGWGPDGVLATNSQLNFPSALAVDAINDLYIADWQNYAIRKVSFPAAPAAGIVNGASFTAPVAPGALISIFGVHLAASTEVATMAPLTTSLAGTSVQVNGTPIPLLLASPGQINAQLPYEVAPGSAALSVTSGAAASAPVTFSVAAGAVGIFLYPGSARAVALNQDTSINSPDHPESRGRVIVCFVTGEGAVNPPVPTGQIAPFDMLSRAVLNSSASVGGAAADVQFLGLTPGFVGLGQANILVPDAAATGDAVPVVITLGGQGSNTAFVSIR